MKREEEIKAFMKKLEKLWLKVPDQRFGQMLFNYTRIGTRNGIGFIQDPFWYQDEDILNDIEESLE